MKTTQILVMGPNVGAEIFSADYLLLRVETGDEVVSHLESCRDFSCLVLPSDQPGLDLLRRLRKDIRFCRMPVMAVGQPGDPGEEAAFLAGADDYIHLPLNPIVASRRIKRLVEQSLSGGEQSQFDRMTGLYTRNVFFKVAKALLSQKNSPRYMMVFLDILHFKAVNELFGIEVGDRVIRRLGRQLTDALPEAVVGRYEADRFLLFDQFSQQRIDMLVRATESQNITGENHYNVTVNFGIYEVDDPQLPMSAIFDRATLALNAITHKHAQRYAIYDENVRRAYMDEQLIIGQMESALKERQFDVYIQPKYNLLSGKMTGGEVLVRWFHPKHGMITPDKFIPIFERNGLIRTLDEFVWERACQLLRGWLDQGRNPLPVSVNISRVNLFNPGLCETILQLIKKYEISPEIFQIEITESAYGGDSDQLNLIMTRLQEHGVKVLMDDFGSAYSSLNILKDLSVDILKIDMRFLYGSDMGGRGANILASVVRLAKWLSLPVIAEGVETGEQASFLRSIGCDEAQGYYFSRPIPTADFDRLLQAPQRDSSHPLPQPGPLVNIDELWQANSQLDLVFNYLIDFVALYELHGKRIEIIRANDGYFDLLDSMGRQSREIYNNLLDSLLPEDRSLCLEAFVHCEKSGQPTVVCFRTNIPGKAQWFRLKLMHAANAGGRSIFYGVSENITYEKNLEAELEDYREHSPLSPKANA